jgi:4-hydroxy-tetrahydrodipicolinate synthase
MGDLNPSRLVEANAACGPAIIWVGGPAEISAPAFCSVGARGFTSGLINVWPERSVAIHAALETGDFAEARKLIAGMKAFEDIRAQEMNGTNVTGVKAALQALGNDCGPTRPPSAWPLAPVRQGALDDFVASIDGQCRQGA